jgi:predicted membrane protein
MNKLFYYYLILFATFLFTFSFIPLIFEIIQYKITINIPYSTIILWILSFIIFLFITINKKYYFHLLFYLIAFISVSIILFLKRIYDNDEKHKNNEKHKNDHKKVHTKVNIKN